MITLFLSLLLLTQIFAAPVQYVDQEAVPFPPPPTSLQKSLKHQVLLNLLEVEKIKKEKLKDYESSSSSNKAYSERQHILLSKQHAGPKAKATCSRIFNQYLLKCVSTWNKFIFIKYKRKIQHTRRRLRRLLKTSWEKPITFSATKQCSVWRRSSDRPWPSHSRYSFGATWFVLSAVEVVVCLISK